MGFIGIEEHWTTPELTAALKGLCQNNNPDKHETP